MRSKLFSIAMSDPSLVEAIAVLLGVVTVSAGFFLILARAAYLAGIYASPITPYGSVHGYVSGFNLPVSIPSESKIKEIAANTFLLNLIRVKLQIWLVSITTFFVAAYPLVSRIRNSIIPAAGITGTHPIGLVWVGLLPVFLTSLGFATVLEGMGVVAFKAYFGIGITGKLLLVLIDINLYIVGIAILFYGLYMITGRPEIGLLLGFLGALGVDRVSLSITGLFVFGVVVNLVSILVIAVALYKRWLSL